MVEIVYVKITTEFVKFITEERGIDNLNAMVRISIDGGQNFLKVIINVFLIQKIIILHLKYMKILVCHCGVGFRG